jgi:hypothetical protein
VHGETGFTKTKNYEPWAVRTVLLRTTSSLSPEMTQTLSWLFYNIQGNTVENAVRKDQHRVFCDKEQYGICMMDTGRLVPQTCRQIFEENVNRPSR